MNIFEFFELSSGKWFSQRTSHDLASSQSNSGKSNLQIDLLETTDSAVIKLCDLYGMDPALARCGLRVAWDGTMDLPQEKQTGSTVLVAIANPDNPQTGKFLQDLGNAEKPALAGQYVLGSDQVLTLTTEADGMSVQERFWFASPNLRLRTSILKQAGGFSMASFCSEIRMTNLRPTS